MITNINYRGQLAPGEIGKIDFPKSMRAPVQHVIRLRFGKMIVFRSGKFRLMGVKSRKIMLNNLLKLPLLPESIEVQSATATGELGRALDLRLLASNLTSRRCQFEPELFPAARLLDFNPLCVNVFSSGKIIMMGVRDLDSCSTLLTNVIAVINQYTPTN